MSELSRKAILPVNKLTVCHEAASQSCSKCYDNKISHSLCTAIDHFPYSSGISVVCYHYRQTGVHFKDPGQRNDPFPGKVPGIFNCAFIYVPHRGADAKSDYFNITGDSGPGSHDS